MDSYSQHDPNLIIQAAEDKKAAGDVQGAQMLFESALLEWGDEAREGAGGDQLREALATLWLAYADFHRINKAWKSAMDTYKQAVSDPVAGAVGRVYLEYARFAEERDKLVTAQKVYLKALVGDDDFPAAVTDEQDVALLWNEFLEMMRKKNPSLTMQGLREAVMKEHTLKRAHPEDALSATGPEEKRSRVENLPIGESKTHVVTVDEVEAERKALEPLVSQMPPDIMAAWMARDGDAPPLAPEHPLFSPTRAKMSDASGRDLIGDEMALRVTERLLCESGSVVLDASRALWLMTALKEKEATQALESLDKNMLKELRALEESQDSRLSVAGAARAAVQVMNENERKAFEESCSQRRQELLSKYAWEFRSLLCCQQTILTKLAVPGFDGPTVDEHTLEFQSSICSLLHTAFFLRKNLGQEQHNKMLESQWERVQRDGRSPGPGSRSPPHSPMPMMGRTTHSPVPVGVAPFGSTQMYGHHVAPQAGYSPMMLQHGLLPPPPPPPPPGVHYGGHQPPYNQR